jgi:hypothetical protein
MKSRASSISFGLFVIVVLAALYSLLAGHGRTNWGLVTVLGGILLLRVVMFWMNLRQQRRNIVRGKGPVRIETRLGLNDEPPEDGPDDAAPTSTGPSTDEPPRP